MSEWLTTGQTIDQLKVGEIAENQFGQRITVNEQGHIVYAFDPDVFVKFTKVKEEEKSRWRIFPKYVTFDEAMKALKSGKIIELHEVSDNPIRFRLEADLIFGVFAHKKLDFRHLFNGKWTIEQ